MWGKQKGRVAIFGLLKQKGLISFMGFLLMRENMVSLKVDLKKDLNY